MNIILSLLLSSSLIIILSSLSCSLYMINYDYKTTTATVVNSSCCNMSDKEYTCHLTIKYTTENDNDVETDIIITSPINYMTNDKIDIEYNTNNLLNVTTKTWYNDLSLLSFLVIIVLLLLCIKKYNKMNSIVENYFDNLLNGANTFYENILENVSNYINFL